MNRILAALAVTAVALPAVAFAQENAFPQVTNDSEGRSTIQYSAGQRGNIVGGGVAVVTGVDEGRPVIEYRGATQAQAPGRPVGVTVVPQTAAQQS